MIESSNAKIDYDEFVKESTVHGGLYLRQDVFVDELKRIYQDGWVYIGHESEIPNAGDFTRTWLGIQPLIFSRDQAGQYHVLYNRCTHRGASICQEDSGNANGFRCEYHGWFFRHNGELAAVPYADGYGKDFDKSELNLRKPPRVAEYRGFVFASASETGRNLLEHISGPARQQIDFFCDLSPEGEVLVQCGATKLAYNGNWKLQMENSIDGYHPNFTHQSFFSTIERMTGSKPDIFDGRSAVEIRDLGLGHTNIDYRRHNLADPGARARLEGMRQTSWGKKYYEDMVDAHGQERADEVILVGGTHMNVFPNLVVLGQQVRTIRPVSAERTEVSLRPTLLKGVPDELNAARIRMYEAFYSPHGGGIHDDVEMFNRIHEGLRCSADPWVIFRRGLHREKVDDDGTRYGQCTDEVSQRAMWRHWKSIMQTETRR